MTTISDRRDILFFRWSMVHDAGNSSFHLPRGVARGKNCDTLCGIFWDDAFAHLHHSCPNLPN